MTSAIGFALALAGAALASPPAATTEAAPTACATIYGGEPVLEPGTVLLLGQIHGTTESPAFAAALLCHAVARGRSVTLALELSEALSTAVDDYLASPGAASDRETLVTHSATVAGYRDGRFSEAIVSLIDTARRLRQQGGAVELAHFVPSKATSEARRERLMAEHIARAVGRQATDLFMVLTGLLHSRVIRGTRWLPEYEPLGYLLSQWHPDWRLLSLAVSHAGGTAWLCTSTHPTDCRPLALTGTGGGTVNAVYFVGEVATTGHHGVYFVGELSYSPPARATPLGPALSDEPVTELPFESQQTPPR